MANRPGLRVRTNGIDNVLSADRSLLLGRDAAADIRYEDQRVSRRHAVLRFDGASWRLEDLGSSNGTYLGDTRITAHVVTGPARLRLGSPVDGPELDVEPVGGDAEPVSAVPAPLPPAVVSPEHTHSLPAALAASSGRAASIDLGTRVAVHPLRSGLVRIGRGPGNEIILADPHVSRGHAELRWDPRGGWQVTDLNSHNGTYVNGHRITTAPLREGDILTMGRRHLRLVPGALEEHESGDVRLDAVDLSVHTSEGRALLQHVSLSVEKGAFVGVVGPSGAGKTTLLNALTGFKPADQGSVFYGGRNLYAEYEELRRRIGYVPQDDIVHAQLTVRAALGYAAELRFPRDVPKVERDQRVAEVIRELGLAERADLVIEKLSGGQRKRVNIAVELLTKPSPLFLDEPTSGLDPGLERGMMTLLRDLAKGGRTVIVVTHAVQSLNLCDRVLVLAPGGRVAFYGPPNAALGYFGRSDFVEVFQDLEVSPDAPWDQRFWASREHADFVARPLASLPPPAPAVGRSPTAPQPARDWPRQTWILLRRHLDTIISDRTNLLFLLAQAPLCALVLLLAFGTTSNELFSPTSRGTPLAQTAVTFIVLVMTLAGMLNSIREIVKESPTYRRERFIGLSIPAYVLSKVLVLGPFTIIQAVILVLVGLANQTGFSGASALGSVRLELIVDAALTGLAAMALGLAISAMVRSSDKAVSALVLVVVAQLVMSLPILDLAHKAVLGQVSWVFSARWGVDVTGSTVNMAHLPGHPPLGSHPEWNHGVWPWTGEVLVLLILTTASLAAAMWLLRRQDPVLLSAPPRAARSTPAQGQPVAGR